MRDVADADVVWTEFTDEPYMCMAVLQYRIAGEGMDIGAQRVMPACACVEPRVLKRRGCVASLLPCDHSATFVTSKRQV